MTEITTLEAIKNELFIQACYILLDDKVDIPLVKQLFDDLLKHSVYSDTFIDVLHSNIDDNSDTFCPAVIKALHAISYPMPENKQQARDNIIHYRLKRIVEQKKPIYHEIGELSILYNNDGNYDAFGPAERLYRECISTGNEYPFSADMETAEEAAMLEAHLFKIAEHCLKNIVTVKEIQEYGVGFIKHQLQFGPVYVHNHHDELLFVSLSETEYTALSKDAP